MTTQIAPAPGRRSLVSGFAALAAMTVPAAAGAVPSGSPDADLIRICEAHPEVIRAAELDSTYEDDCPLWQAYERSRDAIHAAMPVTMVGVLAKARAAKAEAWNSDGTESHGNCPAGSWAWDVVNDLLRLEGRA